MFAIATAELRMLVRNRLVLACAILIPLGLGLVFILRGVGEGAAAIVPLQVLLMIAMGVYITATTTLAARRQNLFLKRLRSGAASDGSIITGLVAPIALISIVQVAIVLTALAVSSGESPAHAWLLAIGVLAVEAMFVGFALATAGVTNSPEHAQITTLPLFFVVLGAAFWSMFSPEGTWVQRVIPGGSASELLTLAWGGGDLSVVPVLLVPTLLWAVVGLVAARLMFRWEPRA